MPPRRHIPMQTGVRAGRLGGTGQSQHQVQIARASARVPGLLALLRT